MYDELNFDRDTIKARKHVAPDKYRIVKRDKIDVGDGHHAEVEQDVRTESSVGPDIFEDSTLMENHELTVTREQTSVGLNAFGGKKEYTQKVNTARGSKSSVDDVDKRSDNSQLASKSNLKAKDRDAFMLKNVPTYDHNNLMQWLQYDSRFLEKSEPVQKKNESQMQADLEKMFEKLLE